MSDTNAWLDALTFICIPKIILDIQTIQTFSVCIEDMPAFLTLLFLFCFVHKPPPTLQYVRGSDPVLKLLDDNGNIAEELSILKWNTDSVEEFLSEKLDRI